ncbi:MAG: hypothetical protein MZV64_69375 [Ignavibacteriales bacterium]|nr:hypothetical protein [Ignavibacteriales bacterium]
MKQKLLITQQLLVIPFQVFFPITDKLCPMSAMKFKIVGKNGTMKLKQHLLRAIQDFRDCMPLLETTDKEIAKLYYMGVLGVIYFRRDNPYSVLGRTYDTLMPQVLAICNFHLGLCTQLAYTCSS